MELSISRSSSSWADQVEEELELRRQHKRISKQITKQKKREAKLGRQIFIGGLDFSDIELLNTPIKNKFLIRDQRRENILKICGQFGEMEETIVNWKERYIFVLYKEKECAEKAITILSSFDERRRISKEIEEKLRSTGVSKNSAFIKSVPKSNYYIRWPHSISSSQDQSSIPSNSA